MVEWKDKKKRLSCGRGWILKANHFSRFKMRGSRQDPCAILFKLQPNRVKPRVRPLVGEAQHLVSNQGPTGQSTRWVWLCCSTTNIVQLKSARQDVDAIFVALQ